MATIARTPASPKQTIKTGHDERTASEPRANSLHSVILKKVQQVNSTIRTFQLEADHAIPFKAGQWLDTFLPGLPRPGGFTITSPPLLAANVPARIELAVQKSAENPAAEWLWQDSSRIIGRELRVRVGGSFVWPPPSSSTEFVRNDQSAEVNASKAVEHVLFVAGGLGINPLMSMVRHFQVTKHWPERVTFLYASKVVLDHDQPPEQLLFVNELRDAVDASKGRMRLKLFLTGQSEQVTQDSIGSSFLARRIGQEDLIEALAGNPQQTVCYVCGVPSMTDEFVDFLAKQDGMSSDRVLCERWW